MQTNDFEYNLDYYSGAQAAMFIENMLIDEVTSLQWTVQQSKVPIYGYASQVFDEMAKGTIIVQGSFSINYVEAGYLHAVLSHVHKYGIKPEVPEWDLAKNNINELNKTAIKNWIDSNLNENGTSQQMWDSYKKLKEAHQEAGKDFTTLTQEINDYVWGVDGSRGLGKGTEDQISENLRRTDQRHLNGFDIYVRFNHEGTLQDTITKIEDVHLVGKSQTVVIDENPVQEVYSFYAKNVI